MAVADDDFIITIITGIIFYANYIPRKVEFLGCGGQCTDCTKPLSAPGFAWMVNGTLMENAIIKQTVKTGI